MGESNKTIKNMNNTKNKLISYYESRATSPTSCHYDADDNNSSSNNNNNNNNNSSISMAQISLKLSRRYQRNSNKDSRDILAQEMTTAPLEHHKTPILAPHSHPSWQFSEYYQHLYHNHHPHHHCNHNQLTCPSDRGSISDTTPESRYYMDSEYDCLFYPSNLGRIIHSPSLQLDGLRYEKCSSPDGPTSAHIPMCIVPLPEHMVEEPSFIRRRNERERERVKNVNDGYDRLKEHLPLADKDRRLSKVETLRGAIDYIRQLQQLLDNSDEQNQRHQDAKTSNRKRIHSSSNRRQNMASFPAKRQRRSSVSSGSEQDESS